jgi:tetratricopeptide (TPR) repeat protein
MLSTPDWSQIVLDPFGLPPTSRAALQLLLRAYPEPVPKTVLADQVWNGEPVSDDSIVRCMATIRRRMSTGAPLTLRTIYGFGYQLVATGTRRPGRPAHHMALTAAAQGEAPWVETLLAARSLLDRRDGHALELARDMLVALVSEAPAYAPAHLLLSEALARLAPWVPGHDSALLSDAGHHLTIATRLQPGVSGALALRAHLHDLAWRFDLAEPWHVAAQAKDPGNPATHEAHGVHLWALGRLPEAVAALRRAVALRPVSVNLQLLLSRALFAAGDGEGARIVAERARPHARVDCTNLSIIAAQSAYMTGTVEPDALAVHEACPDSYAFKASHIAYHFAVLGDREKASAALESLGTGNAAAALGAVPALLRLGRIDGAMACVEQAADAGIAWLPMLIAKPENRALARHRRFARLQRRFTQGAMGAGRSESGQDLPMRPM